MKKIWNIRVKVILIMVGTAPGKWVNQWNTKLTLAPIIGAFEIVLRCLEKRLRELLIRGRIENIQTTAILKSARILRRTLKNLEDLLSY